MIIKAGAKVLVSVFMKAKEGNTVRKDGLFTIDEISRAMQTFVLKPAQE